MHPLIMGLHSGMKNGLGALLRAIETQTIRTFILQLLLGVIFIAMIWPYILCGSRLANRVLSGEEKQRENELEALHER